MNYVPRLPRDIKKDFTKKGSCSQAFCFFLDREFDGLNEGAERAADPFAGGILLRGQQCGMLWGSCLASGAEAGRRHGDRGKATAAAITAARHLAESYARRASSMICRDLTGYDFTKKFDLARFMAKFILHINRSCLDLAAEWHPEAVKAADEGLAETLPCSRTPVSCASVTAEKMGATADESLMVAGFAGGMGLTGNGCGALAAAIWLNSLAWMKKFPGKSTYNNAFAKQTLKKFLEETGGEMRCAKICGREFATIDEHSEYVANGGCAKLIESLAQA